MEVIAGISIIGLVGIIIWQAWLGHKERLELAKVYKAKDLQEVEYLFPPKQSTTPKPVDDDIVDLEDFNMNSEQK